MLMSCFFDRKTWFIVLLIAYVGVYAFGFDKNSPTYDKAFSKIEFKASPKWVESELIPCGYTCFGRKTTFWNYIFYPVDAFYRLFRGK